MAVAQAAEAAEEHGPWDAGCNPQALSKIPPGDCENGKTMQMAAMMIILQRAQVAEILCCKQVLAEHC